MIQYKHILIIFSLFVALTGQSQTATITGVVRDTISCKPTAGTNIRILSSGSGSNFDITLTDSCYTIGDILPGVYDIVFYLHENESIVRNDVVLLPNQRMIIDVFFEPRHLVFFTSVDIENHSMGRWEYYHSCITWGFDHSGISFDSEFIMHRANRTLR